MLNWRLSGREARQISTGPHVALTLVTLTLYHEYAADLKIQSVCQFLFSPAKSRGYSFPGLINWDVKGRNNHVVTPSPQFSQILCFSRRSGERSGSWLAAHW